MREDKNLNKECTEGNQQYIFLIKGMDEAAGTHAHTKKDGMRECEWEWVKESGWYDDDGNVTPKSMLLYVNLSVCGSCFFSISFKKKHFSSIFILLVHGV